MEEAFRQVLLPVWNAWRALTINANAAGDDAPAGEQTDLDRYLLAKVHDLTVDDGAASGPAPSRIARGLSIGRGAIRWRVPARGHPDHSGEGRRPIAGRSRTPRINAKCRRWLG